MLEFTLGVDAGNIGIVPQSAFSRDEFHRGLVVPVRVRADHWLTLQYEKGYLFFNVANTNYAGEPGIFVTEDTDFYIGDVCYILDPVIPTNDPNWDTAEDPAPGYWAACVCALAVDRAGVEQVKPFEAAPGVLGFVAPTRYGDGAYQLEVYEDNDGYLSFAVVQTGNDDEDEYDEDEEE